ncbi:uncharacterized protein HMPREF1541_09252 [Cyphellophora europaea CBS 101466]|uniref:Uncharacterized protein n=1 Tax=Cyphellophora europaea (strain CBS 101466) TaxID=1220924 RepID=W2S9N1_CYPE1|nr:uncharacterized protein HMPREF1541_09252 [Cyphellophora europaea CBS 101466]ETN45421.1 hypothetical protein HMPREF1541_09252 [Cyphellophora europaea CBS 101466]
MSVEQFGASLLGEVREESLDELLRDLATTLDPRPKDILGLREVDRLLELFRYHRPGTPTRRPGWTTAEEAGEGSISGDVDAGDPAAEPLKARPPIIEISSTLSAAGKTSFLYLLTAHALLPVLYGGLESTALWLDTDGRFSALRLSHIMSHLLSASPSQPSSSTIHSTIDSSLRQLHILTPTTSSQLLASLESLPSALLSLASSRPFRLLILDSATAFAHQDRFDADIARLEAGAEYYNASRPRTPSRTAQIISALCTIQQQFRCTLIFTTTPQHPGFNTRPLTTPATTSSGSATGGQRPQHQHQHQHQPQRPDEPVPISPWNALATLTLKVERTAVTQFAPSAGLTECLRDREKRQEAVGAGKFVVRLDWEGAERWPPGVREVVLGGGGVEGGRGRIEMRIHGEGVDVG